MGITLSDRERRFIALLTEASDATVRDCIVADDGRLVFVVAPDDMAAAIGPDGRTVRALEDRLDREVRLVADADSVEHFVANALAPAAVYGVEVEARDGDRVAIVDVDPADRGAAIGAGGRNIEAARRLAKRHYEIDDIELAE